MVQSQHIAARPLGAMLPGGAGKPPISGTHKERRVTFLSFPILLLFSSLPFVSQAPLITSPSLITARTRGILATKADVRTFVVLHYGQLVNVLAWKECPKSHLLNSEQPNSICNSKALDFHNHATELNSVLAPKSDFSSHFLPFKARHHR